MNKEQLADNIIKTLIPKDFGKSFTELKKDIYKNYKANGYGASDHFKAIQSGYAVFLTDNPNYANGEKQGNGAGYYAALNGVGMVRTIKLAPLTIN